MLYVVGDTSRYDYLLRVGGSKTGRFPGYPGGSAWQTYDEAAKHRRSDQSVYGIEADWAVDTQPSCEGRPWHDLLRDARLVAANPAEVVA